MRSRAFPWAPSFLDLPYRRLQLFIQKDDSIDLCLEPPRAQAVRSWLREWKKSPSRKVSSKLPLLPLLSDRSGTLNAMRRLGLHPRLEGFRSKLRLVVPTPSRRKNGARRNPRRAIQASLFCSTFGRRGPPPFSPCALAWLLACIVWRGS
jgi:hypothetical protein